MSKAVTGSAKNTASAATAKAKQATRSSVFTKRSPAKPAEKAEASAVDAKTGSRAKPAAAAKKSPARPKTSATKRDGNVGKSIKKSTVESKAKRPVKKTVRNATASQTAPSANPADAKAPARKSYAKQPVAAKKPVKTAAKKAAGKTKVTKASSARKSAAKKAVGKRQLAKIAPTKQAAPKSKTATSRSPARFVKQSARTASARRIAKPEADEVVKEFRKVVNLTPEELERRLSTPIAKKLGLRDEAKAGIFGHESGRKILEILAKSRRAYTDEDLRHMKKVVAYVRKRRSEKPPGDIFASNWRFSLLNWGHDPMRPRKR